MPRHFASLRVRLTLAYMLVFGLIQAAVCLVILVQRERRDALEFDERLLEQARAVGAYADRMKIDSLSSGLSLEFPIASRVIDPARVFCQVRLLDGTLVAHSPTRESTSLQVPLPPDDELRRQRTVFVDFADESVERLLGPREALRIVHLYHVPEIGAPLIVQVGTTHDVLDELIAERRRMFLLISVLALVPAGLTTWLLAKRALRPLSQVADQVQVISPWELKQRIKMADPPEELVQLTETVNAMLARLDKAFSAQDRFLTNAAHELKTPLAILLGEAQVLRRNARSVEEYEEYLAGTEAEMRRLGQTVDGLLMLARAQARDPERQSVSVNEFVTDALESCQPLARQGKVQLMPRFAWNGEYASDPIVLGDSRLLATMLENLVRNAVRLTAAGDAVEVEVSAHANTVQIAVRDRGPGVPDRDKARIFEEFITEEVGGRATGGSTGIGLALARSIIHLHGGSIGVRDREGGGAEFIVRLPLADPPGDSESGASADAQPPEAP